MPPKKPADVPAVITALEGEFDRKIEVRIKGKMSENLRNPSFHVYLPGEDDAKKFQFSGDSTQDLDLEIYTQTLLVNHANLKGILSNDIIVKVFVSQEVIVARAPTPVQAKAPPPKKAPAPAGGGGGGAGSKDTAPVVQESQVEIGRFSFNFIPLFKGTGKVVKIIKHIHAFSSLCVDIKSDAALLSESQLQRLWPLIIHVISLDDLPDARKVTLQGVSPGNQGDYAKLQSSFKGVTIKSVFHNSVQPYTTQPIPHSRHLAIDTARVYFLKEIFRTPLELLQHLFQQTMTFEVHDRDPINQPEGGGGGNGPPSMGVVEVSLQQVLFNHANVVFKFSEAVKAKLAPVSSAQGSRPPVLATPDYISFNTVLSLRCSFLAPVPRLEFVPVSVNGEQRSGNLTCMMVTMKHTGANVAMALRAVLSTVVKFGNVSAPEHDVQEWKKPTTPSTVVEVVEVKDDKKKPPAKPAGKAAPGPAVPEVLPETPAATEPQEVTPWGQVRTVVKAALQDTVSGFEVMDSEERIFFIESVRGSVLKEVHTALLPYIEDGTVHVVMEPQLAYPKRLFFEYPPLVRVPTLPTSPHAGQPPRTADTDADKPITAVPAAKPPPKGAGAKAPAGGGKAPGPQAPEAQPSAETAPPPPPTDLAQPQLADPGGVLGRLRRMKIAPTLGSIAVTQSHYLHGNQSKLCINAVEKLLRLKTIRRMQEAFDYHLIPTPEELVALERAFGQTLSTRDVCDRDMFTPFDMPLKEGSQTNQSAMSKATKSSNSLRRSAHDSVRSMSRSQVSGGMGAFNPEEEDVEEEPNVAVDPSAPTVLPKVVARNRAFDKHIKRREKRLPASLYCKTISEHRQRYADGHSIDCYANGDSDDDMDDRENSHMPVYEARDDDVLVETDFVHMNKAGAYGTTLRTTREIPRKGVIKTTVESLAYVPPQTDVQKALNENNIRIEKGWSTMGTRTAEEDNKHRLKPSDQRVEDLKQPWVCPYESPIKRKKGSPTQKGASTTTGTASGTMKFSHHAVGVGVIPSVFSGIPLEDEDVCEVRGAGKGLSIPLKSQGPTWKTDVPHSIFKPNGDPPLNKRDKHFYYASASKTTDVWKKKHGDVNESEKKGPLWYSKN
eukprot:PhF_6_TR31808/c0_g1_i2/m.46939